MSKKQQASEPEEKQIASDIFRELDQVYTPEQLNQEVSGLAGLQEKQTENADPVTLEGK